MQTSCAADSKLVTGGVKYESRRGCFVGIHDTRPCSLGAHFQDVALSWSLWNSRLTVAYRTLSRGSTILPFTDQNL